MVENLINPVVGNRVAPTKFNPSTLLLSEREDQATIRKTQRIPIPGSASSDPMMTLKGRVTVGKVEEPPISANTIVKELEKIEPEHFRAVEEAISQDVPTETNFMIKVQFLVAKILAQLNRIAEKDRTQTEKLKTDYKNATAKVAELQRELGTHGLKFSLIAFGASFLQFASPHQSDRDIAKIFASELCPKLGEMFGSSLQANMNQSNSLASLFLQEYQAKSSKGANDASNKQEIIGILEKALDSLKQAARAG